uniref:C2H2-type domain-containing protein n=1 Tax=Otus sunia TaxID=257818 RepID=A0A8C8BAD9_9STRI
MSAEDTEEGTAQPPSSSREKYMCEYCGNFLVLRTTLTSHQRTHTGEMPFECQDCGRSFVTSGGLLRHRRTHTKKKPFTCTTCGRIFSNSTDLIRHQQTQTGEGVYPCLHCGKNFQQCCLLREHQKALHNGLHSTPCPVQSEAGGGAAASWSQVAAEPKPPQPLVGTAGMGQAGYLLLSLGVLSIPCLLLSTHLAAPCYAGLCVDGLGAGEGGYRGGSWEKMIIAAPGPSQTNPWPRLSQLATASRSEIRDLNRGSWEEEEKEEEFGREIPLQRARVRKDIRRREMLWSRDCPAPMESHGEQMPPQSPWEGPTWEEDGGGLSPVGGSPRGSRGGV